MQTGPQRQATSPPSLDERAAADLRFIRGTMERSSRFTAVPGMGGMAMGAVALCGAVVAHFQGGAAAATDAWLLTWIVTGLAGAAAGIAALRRKAARVGERLARGSGRRFLFCLCPSLLVGALLTAAMARAGSVEMLPAVWLLCYGAGVVAAGALSVPLVPATGAAFLTLGSAALVAPAAWGDAMMALGFGGLHLVAGYFVARRHGG